MATKVNPRGGVSPAVVIISVVVLVVVVGWLGYINLFAPPSAPPPTAAQQATLDKYDALAKKSHGDITKLPQDEQDKFMQETGGHGAQILQSIAKQKGY